MVCQNKKSNNHLNFIGFDTIKNNNVTKNCLEKQLNRGYRKYFNEAGVEIPQETFDLSDIDITVQMGKKILISNGYNFIPTNKFYQKIKDIFDRIVEPNSDKSYLYVNYFDDCDRKFNYYPYDGTDHNGTYIIKRESFITDFYFIPQLIDYKKEFPEVIKLESSINKKYKNKEGEEITIELWKEFPDLANQRKNNIQTLVARNMYLFNDSRAHFKWLILNDEYFMQSLVTTFGYYEDKELLKWVVDKIEFTNQNIDQVKKNIYNKKCDGKIVFDQQLLNILVEDEVKATQFYEFIRYYYIDWLLNHKNNTEFTFSQKAEIIARIHSFIYSHAKEYRTVDFMGKFAEYNDSDNKYSKEFKLKNYYNIPEFEKQWKQAKIDGDGISLPGEE
jgi:hypothetical protein